MCLTSQQLRSRSSTTIDPDLLTRIGNRFLEIWCSRKQSNLTVFWHRVWYRNTHINSPFTQTHPHVHLLITHSLIHIDILFFPPLHCLTSSILAFQLCLCLCFVLLSQHTVYIFVCCTFVIMLMSFPFFVIIIWWPSRHCAPLLLTPSVNPSCRFRCSPFIFVNIFSWMPAGCYSARSEISEHGIVEIDALDAQL